MEKYKNTGILLEQREGDNPLRCFVFIEEVGKLIHLATVARLDDGNSIGYQRLIKCTKVKSIEKFIASNKNNIIPNAITLAIGKELNCNLDKLENSKIEFEYEESKPPFLDDLMACKNSTVNTEGLKIEKKALIIDGQHRLYGLYKNNPKNKILVTAIINPELADQAFQYIVINQKSQSASTVDVKSVINSNEYKNDLKDRLIEVGITYGNTATILDYFNSNRNSPFRGILDWQNTEDKTKRIVQLNAIEQVYKYCNLEIRGIADETQLLEFISIIWNKIKTLFINTWEKTIENKRYSNLLKKATIISVTEFIVREAKIVARQSKKQILDLTSTEIDEIVQNSIGDLPDEFFTVPWQGGLDTSAGREIIKASIDIVLENIAYRYEWNQKVPVIKK